MAKLTAIFRKLVADFPCMVADDAQFRSYSGFMKVGEREFRVAVSSDCSSFQADNELKMVLQPCMELVKDRLKNASNTHVFLLELRDQIEHQMKTDAVTTDFESGLPPAQFYERILAEISQIGWKCVSSMNESMRVLDLAISDSAGRKQVVNVTLSVDYPTHRPRCVTGLPVEFELQWGNESTLGSVIRQFGKAAEECQDFFRAMEDLDKMTWVLEPEHPTMRERYRRVALGRQCSVRLEIDPRTPIKGFPEVGFLGSEAAIGPFKEKLNRNIHLWDTSGKTLPRGNLERVLEVSFPKREVEEAGEEEGMALECGICYSYRLEEAVPDVACDLAECSKPYHRQCLVEWLRALPDTRESFGTITGCCVYCEQSISVSVAT